MSYQRIKTPRFYIDTLLWMKTVGLGSPDTGQDIFSLNPYSKKIHTTDAGGSSSFNFNFPNPIDLGRIDYIAFLGLGQSPLSMTLRHPGTGTMDDLFTTHQITSIVNFDEAGATVGYSPGYSIASVESDYGDFENIDTVNFTINTGVANSDFMLNCGSIGKIYNMPVSPDLSVSFEHDYSGIKNLKSPLTGATHSNANWIKPPTWGGDSSPLEAWELMPESDEYWISDVLYDGVETIIEKHLLGMQRHYSGKRVWNLSFSYISDSDLEPRNYTGTKLDDNSLPVPNDNNWFENVLHYTLGGSLPFIFCPDPSIIFNVTDIDGEFYVNTVPEFAICRIDMESLKREQVAPGVYNIKIKVKESW